MKNNLLEKIENELEKKIIEINGKCLRGSFEGNYGNGNFIIGYTSSSANIEDIPVFSLWNNKLFLTIKEDELQDTLLVYLRNIIGADCIIEALKQNLIILKLNIYYKSDYFSFIKEIKMAFKELDYDFNENIHLLSIHAIA